MCGCRLGSLFCCQALAILTISCPAQNAPANSPSTSVELQRNVSLERTLAGLQTDVFTVTCPAGDYLHIAVEQKGIDVVVSILDPAGKVLVAADSPNGANGPEPASAICSTAGTYSIQVSSFDRAAPRGKYDIHLTALQPPQKEDLLQIDAEQSMFASQLVKNGDQASKLKAIDLLRKAAQDWSALGNKYENSLCVLNIAGLYFALGQMQSALEFSNQALSLQIELHDHRGEATTLNTIALLYAGLGQRQRALDFSNQALTAEREVGDRDKEAETLSNIGFIYDGLGQREKALDFYIQALTAERESGNRGNEAVTLNNIASTYSNLGEKQKALDSLYQVLAMERELGNRDREATALSNIGVVSSDLGQDREALDSFNQLLAIRHQLGDRSGEASALIALGMVSYRLGQQQSALDYFNQALPIKREVGDREGEAEALNNLGLVYSDRNELPKALSSLQQVLSIERELGNRALVATVLNNLGAIYSDLGQTQKALDSLNEALPIEHEIGDPSAEAYTLSNLGYIVPFDSKNGLSFMLAARSLAMAVGDLDFQGEIDDRLMGRFRDQSPELGILFGIDGVNSFQKIRKNISSLKKELQAGFTQSKSDTYRELAELLVQTDRLGEAEQVLDLLKEQELKEIVRGGSDDAAAKVEPLKLSAPQQKALADLAVPEKMAASLIPFTMEQSALLAKAARSAEEEGRLKTLNATIDTQSGEIAAYFKDKLAPELTQTSGSATAPADVEAGTQSYLQNTLAALGPHVIGIRILFGDQHAYAIIVTAHTRQKFELKATPAELRSQVLQVRDDLRSQDVNPKPHLQELYAMVVSPLDSVLTKLEADSAPSGHLPTLLWSLDGVLRYVPMAALYDGNRYMLERFDNVLFTPNSYGHMAVQPRRPSTQVNVLAMGLSKSYGGEPALPAVMQELDAIVRDPAVPASHGPMEGRLLPNDQFTLTALESELGAGKTFPVVHIASHYGIDGSDNGEPFLLLGGETRGVDSGYKLTLSKLETSSISFHNTQLLTLSACSTAKDYRTRNGVEMDSLGMVAQQKEAAAVLATLWSVNDASTSLLMSDFYRRWATIPNIEKIEALRQAQIAMLHGKLQPAGETYDLSHPYYWAPFVLIGNFR